MKQINRLLLVFFIVFKFYSSYSQTLLWSRFDSSDVVYNPTNPNTVYGDKTIAYRTASNGDIIALHWVRGNVRFGNQTYNISTPFAIIKIVYDKSMNVKSSVKLLNNVIVNGFDLDEKDNLYIYGIFVGTTYITPSDSIKSMHATSWNTFVLKFTNNNIFKWVKTINNDQGYVSPTKIMVSNDRIYLLGYLTSGRLIYNRTQIYNWNYSYNLDYFIALDTSGAFQFINRIRVSNQSLPITIKDFDIDTMNKTAYFIGDCREGGQVFTDKDTIDLTSGISGDNRIVFILNLKSGLFIKSKIIFTNGSGTHSYSIRLNSNYIYIMSSFLGNISLLDTTINKTKSEFFLLKTDTSFKRQWMKVTSNDNSGNYFRLSFDSYDNAILVSTMYDSVFFNDIGVSKSFNNFWTDNFVFCFNKLSGKSKWAISFGSDSSEQENSILQFDNRVLVKSVLNGINEIKFNGISYTSNKPQAASFLISNDQLLNLPGKLSATALSESSIKLNWYDSSAGEELYIIERSPNGTSNWIIIDSVAGNTNIYTNTGLNTLTTYYYRIRAKCIYNTSAPGNTAQATTLAASTVPNPPSNLVAATVNKNLVLTWNDNSNNETGFKLYRSTTSGGTFNLIDSVLANVTTYTNFNLASGNYCYKVKAYNSLGLSVYSNESCHNFVGIEAGSLPNSFRIYPQPFKEIITIANSQELIKKVVILSIDGKVIFEQDQIKLHEFNIKTASITAGNYLLNITTMDGKAYNSNLVKE